MPVSNSDTFVGKPIEEWHAGTPIRNPANRCYRIRVSWDESDQGIRWTDKFAEFLDDPKAKEVFGVVVGAWDFNFDTDSDSARVVEALVAAHRRLPDLKALFVGDLSGEENEISWIQQSDMSALFNAYPALEHFGVRGNDGLSLGRLKHAHLKTLIVETGGLDVSVVQQVANAQLPELTHLELWLGTNHYGWNGTIDDVKPLIYDAPFPKLTYLGLRDSEIADEIAVELAKSPILEQIEVLDLSLGTLGDVGVQALLTNPAIHKLQKLDIHYHFCSDEMMQELRKLNITVNMDDQQFPDEEYSGGERYVAVSE